jgi:hypothetical protein
VACPLSDRLHTIHMQPDGSKVLQIKHDSEDKSYQTDKRPGLRVILADMVEYPPHPPPDSRQDEERAFGGEMKWISAISNRCQPNPSPTWVILLATRREGDLHPSVEREFTETLWRSANACLAYSRGDTYPRSSFRSQGRLWSS